MLAWAMIGFRPCASNSFWQNARAKEAARILLALEIDDEGAFEFGFSEDHNQLRRTEWATSVHIAR